MKKFIALSFLLCSSYALGASYLVTVETSVANKAEDKFSFSLSEGDTQTKGFDGMLMAKRYRAQGFPHRALDAKKELEADELKNAEMAKLKPADIVKDLLDKAVKERDLLDRRIETTQGKRDTLDEKIKSLESLAELSSRNSPGFKSAFDAFKKKYEMTEEDLKYRKILKKRPRYTGDIEEIDYGSFCNMTLVKANGKNITVNMDYAYSRILSSFYSDGNNNSNSITKHPIIERFEKLGITNLRLSVGKPYCIQFGRLSPEKNRSLSEALSKSGIFGGGGASAAQEAEPVEERRSELDAYGLLSEIKRKYASDGGRVARVVITVKIEK